MLYRELIIFLIKMEKYFYFITKLGIKISSVFNFFIPVTNIICINMNTLQHHKFTITYYWLYFMSYFILRIFCNLSNKINKYLINYKQIYLYQDKYYISSDFIINFKKLNQKSDLSLKIIDSVKLKLNNNSELEITHQIKKYDNQIPFIIFLKLININMLEIDHIIINSFTLGKIENKSINAKEILKKNIGDLWI